MDWRIEKRRNTHLQGQGTQNSHVVFRTCIAKSDLRNVVKPWTWKPNQRELETAETAGWKTIGSKGTNLGNTSYENF